MKINVVPWELVSFKVFSACHKKRLKGIDTCGIATKTPATPPLGADDLKKAYDWFKKCIHVLRQRCGESLGCSLFPTRARIPAI